MKRSAVFAVVGLCLAVLPAGSDEQKRGVKLDPSLTYSAARSRPVTYQVDFAAIVTPPYKTKSLKVWMPVPPTDGGQEVAGSEFSTFPAKVEAKIGTEKKYGNRFAYFEFTNPQGAQIIRHRFTIKVWELRWGVDPGKVEQVEDWPKSFAPYLEGDSSVALNDPLRKAAKLAVPKRVNQARDLADAMDWVNGYMKYDHAAGSLRASAAHALDRKSGHCSDYHGLCASVGRALGYPTRVCYGINPFPKNSPSHCKLEAFLPGYGWVSFDVSETQKLLALVEKDSKLGDKEKAALKQSALSRLRSGFRDNTWYLQTRGTDYDLEPKATRRAPVVRTIYAEADGEALPEPDPAAAKKREFSWMTAHEYKPDRAVRSPFEDLSSLAPSK